MWHSVLKGWRWLRASVLLVVLQTAGEFLTSRSCFPYFFYLFFCTALFCWMHLDGISPASWPMKWKRPHERQSFIFAFWFLLPFIEVLLSVLPSHDISVHFSEGMKTFGESAFIIHLLVHKISNYSFDKDLIKPFLFWLCASMLSPMATPTMIWSSGSCFGELSRGFVSTMYIFPAPLFNDTHEIHWRLELVFVVGFTWCGLCLWKVYMLTSPPHMINNRSVSIQLSISLKSQGPFWWTMQGFAYQGVLLNTPLLRSSAASCIFSPAVTISSFVALNNANAAIAHLVI